ncbi:MAG: hypothetical protein EAX89_00485 [Candidatus Lokiarchaeota archaeon]|nr:hypothetical protein [Candidatus Lokiarchaeota archaeon]
MLQKIFQNLIGIQKGNQRIFSIWGDFGVGKTILSLQLLLQNKINNYKSIFIYSKPNLPFMKIKNVFGQQLKEVLSEILLINSIDFNDLYQLSFNLEFYVLQNNKSKDKQINLILIDSLTDLYRLELNQEKKDKNFILNYKLNTILGNLAYLNKNYGINIVIINEMSKKSVDGEIIQVEAGGNVMDYWVPHSMKIERTNRLNERKFILFDKNNHSKDEFTQTLRSNGFNN